MFTSLSITKLSSSFTSNCFVETSLYAKSFYAFFVIVNQQKKLKVVFMIDFHFYQQTFKNCDAINIFYIFNISNRKQCFHLSRIMSCESAPLRQINKGLTVLSVFTPFLSFNYASNVIWNTKHVAVIYNRKCLMK